MRILSINLLVILALNFVAMPAFSSIIPIQESQNGLAYDGNKMGLGGEDDDGNPYIISDPTQTCIYLVDNIPLAIENVNNTMSASGTGCAPYTAPLDVDHADITLTSETYSYISNKTNLDDALIHLDDLYNKFDNN